MGEAAPPRGGGVCAEAPVRALQVAPNGFRIFRLAPGSFTKLENLIFNHLLESHRYLMRSPTSGYTVFASSPADFATFIAAYTEKWAKVIKFSGAKIY
jgi:hypothetical protein